MVRELGTASDRDGVFVTLAAAPGGSLSSPDPSAALALERSLVPAGGSLALERMLLLTGFAEHRFESAGGERSWRESFTRVHLSIVNHRLQMRLSIDDGGAEWDRTATDDIRERIETFARATPLEEPRSFERLRLSADTAARIVAALYPLARAGALGTSSRWTMRQKPHPTYRYDGFGEIIEPLVLAGGAPESRSEPRNWFRPSYRSRPRRTGFHLALDVPAVRDDGDAPTAVAIGPARIEGGSLEVDLLISGHDTPRTGSLVIDATSLPERLLAAPGDPSWFPLGAGAWGTPMLLEQVRVFREARGSGLEARG